MRALLLAAVVAAAAPAVAGDNAWRFACDGTDPFLLSELDEAMRSGVGYGETWDETVCNRGNLVLGEGVRSRKPKPVVEPATTVADAGAGEAAPAGLAGEAAVAAVVEPPKPKLTPLQQKMQDQYFAIFIPVFGMMMAAFCVLVAGVVVFFLRRRKQVVVDVDCPACRRNIPFLVGDSTHIFCPRCGAACRVDVEVRGVQALATAVPL